MKEVRVNVMYYSVNSPHIWVLLLNRSRYFTVLPAAERTEVHPLSQCSAQRPETCKYLHQYGPTIAQDRRLWLGQDRGPSLLS